MVAHLVGNHFSINNKMNIMEYLIDQKLENTLTKDIEWSIWYLKIYDISKDKAIVLINNLIKELSMVSWTNVSDNDIHTHYTTRLKRKIAEIKKSHYSVLQVS